MNENAKIILKHGTSNRSISKIALCFVLGMASIITLYPLIWMLYTSLKSNKDISMSTFALPATLHFENYANAWKQANIGTYFINSIIVSVTAIIFTVFIGAAAAFILSKFRFSMQKGVYSIFIVGMLIPLQSILVPLFIQMRTLRLLDSLWSLILTYTAFGLPITIFIMESFMRAFPDEILEASIIDGSPIYKMFLKIILPMTKPAIASVVILNFLNNWKEFSFALIFISVEQKKTLPLGLYNFLGAETSNYAGLMAALVISSIPVIAIYLLLQKQVIDGMTAGAVKG